MIIEKSTSRFRQEEVYYVREEYGDNQFNSDDEAPPKKGKNDKESSYVEFEFPKSKSRASLVSSQIFVTTE